MCDHWLTRLLAASLTIFIISLLVVPTLAATPTYFQRGLALLLSLVLGILYRPTRSNRFPVPARVFDGLVVLLSIVSFGYIVANSTAIVGRVGAGNTADLVASVLGTLVVLELARRWTPPALLYLSLFFAAYVFLGHLVPVSVLKCPPVSIEQFITYTMISQEGILGVGVAVMVDIIFIFLVFSAILKLTGIGDFILNFAKAAVGRFTGGPALAAVVGSSLFGMVSGSPVANVAAVGTITIPLMMRVGYHPYFAGAVEAVASTGGQIMPPVMGSIAFFIAEVTGTPYVKIAMYAIIPALVYYSSAAFSVWLEAKRIGLSGLPKSELPNLKEVLRSGWFCLLPLVLLVVLLVVGLTPQRSAWYASLLAAAIGVLKRAGIRKFVDVLIDAARSSLGVMIAVACIGIVIASIAVTGLAPKLAALVAAITGGSWLIGLLVVAIFAIILGMGLPPLPVFIVVYVATAQIIPHLTALGIPVLAVYMFMFYYSAMAPVTPPVALAAYTAAGIAGTDPFLVGWRAFGLALAGFAVPFLFVQHPQLLLMGQLWPDMLLPIGKACLLIFSGALVTVGWFIKNLSVWQRALGFLAVIGLILPVGWGLPAALALLVLGLLPIVFKRGRSGAESA